MHLWLALTDTAASNSCIAIELASLVRGSAASLHTQHTRAIDRFRKSDAA